jgi:LysM repeat protein
MKNRFIGFIITFFILLSFSSMGQSTNYPVKKINGVEFYVYKVMSAEGFMAIGRKFDVPADEIANANPYLKNGLKVGQEILIPIHKNQRTKTAEKPEFIQHKVERKQTLFAISHKYNVSQEDIEKLNPDVKNGLKEGMILNIPDSAKIKKTKTSDKLSQSNAKPETQNVKQTESRFVIHKVLPKETLFSICKQYNVDAKDVVKLNPGVIQSLPIGSELKIPAKVHQNEIETKKVASETLQLRKEPIPMEEVAKTKTIKIAFLLPFMLDQSKKEPVLERFQNFYAGALLAIKAAKEKGISFEIYTYDTDKTEEKITEVLNNHELKSMDLIIGPAFSNQVPLVAGFAKENKVHTLIPFTAKVPDIENNPYLFQFNPGSENELKYLIELLNGKWRNMQVVFAEVTEVRTSDEGKIREEALKIELKHQRRSFKVIDLSSSDNSNIPLALKKSDKNLIIFDTDKYSNVSPYLNSFASLSSTYDIVLFEQYSWKNQMDKKIETICISPFLTNSNEHLITDYNDKFDHYFGKDVSNDSPRYDILGFDLTNYFIANINRFGSKFVSKSGSLNSIPAIQSQPIFERFSTESGFINQRLYIDENKAQ